MSYTTRQCTKIPAINVKQDVFKNTFFFPTKIEWNKSDWKIKTLKELEIEKKEFYHSLGYLLIAH